MTKRILYITETLCKCLSIEHLQSIQKACDLAEYKYSPHLNNSKAIKSIALPNVILASEKCLSHLLKNENFTPQSNFVILGGHREDLSIQNYKSKIKNLRFVLGEPPLPLLELILTHTLNFFKSPVNLNISSHFDHKNCISLSCELKNSKERDEMQNNIAGFFQDIIEKNKSTLTTGVSTYVKNLTDILEEFLMNAIWDANPKYAQVDRTKPVELLESEKVNIFCLFDGTHFILSVTDLFGSFSQVAIEKHIQFSLGIKEENTINDGTGGAGIGLFMILQKIGILVFEVEKGKATRATAIARGDQPLRDMQKKSRTLLFYEK